MKKLIPILFLLLCSTTVWANPEKSTKSSKSDDKTVSIDKDSDMATENKSETEALDTDLKTDPKTQDSDSSQYSVNKFNYLFYLIYKVKYLDFDDGASAGPEISLQE